MENIGKKVFVQNSGEYFGYVLNVVISQEDFKKLGYIVVEEKTEGEFFLLQNDIAFCKDAVFVSDMQCFQLESSALKSLIGKDVFDECGRFYGRVCNIEIVKNKLNKLKTSLCEIPVKFLNRIDGDCIFASFSKRKISRKKVVKKKKIEIVVSDEQFLKIPQKVNMNANYYVGKTSKSDVFGYNNERILQKNIKITQTIFENIKKHNKLNELFFLLNN